MATPMITNAQKNNVQNTTMNNGSANAIMNIIDPQDTKNKHYELIDKFILNDYPEIAEREFNDYTDLGVQIRPIIVGGSAYRIHMINNDVLKKKKFESLPTDDIDLKFFVQNPSTYNLWRKYRASLIIPIVDRFRNNAQSEGLEPTFWLHYRDYKRKEAIRINSGNLNYLVQEIQNTQGFDIPVDLLCITVKYPSSKVSLGLVDLSVISPQGSGYVYNMFADYRRVVNPKAPIKVDIVDNNLGMEILNNNKNAAFSSHEYILLDTARMIAKVELLGSPSVSYADVYKYVKYIIKFYHLSFIGKPYSTDQVQQLNFFVDAIKQVQLPKPSNSSYMDALKRFHNQIKEIDRTTLQLLSMWFDNEGLLKVITNHMIGGDGFVQLNNRKLKNVQVSKITKENVRSQQATNSKVRASQTIKMNMFLQGNKRNNSIQNSENVSIYESDFAIDENSKDLCKSITSIWTAFTQELEEIYKLVTKKQRAGRISMRKKVESKANVRKQSIVRKTTDKSKSNAGNKKEGSARKK